MIIYKATNIINNECYIGQTKQKFDIRIKQHIYLAKRGKRKSSFHRSINKYVEDSFNWEILCECNTHEELDEMEYHYIKQYNSHIDINGYNLTEGGNGNHGLCKESREKISKAFRGKNNPQWGKRGKETPMYGKKHSEETKRKMSSKSSTGSKNPMYGKKQTQEEIDKRFEYLKYTDNCRSKEYIVITPDGEEIKIKSMNKFCKEHGLRSQNMYTVASGGQKTHKGYKCVRL